MMTPRTLCALSAAAIALIAAPTVKAQLPLPTNLVATGFDGQALFEWRLDNPAGVLGFAVFRSRFPDTGFVQVDPVLLLAGPGGRYAFLDKTVDNGVRFYYRVEVTGLRGETRFSETASAIPEGGAGLATPDPALYVAIGTATRGTQTVARPDVLTPPPGTGGAVQTHAERLLGIDLARAGIRLLDYDSSGATIEIVPPDALLVRVGARNRLEMDGYSQSLDPAGPEVPTRRFLLAMPAAARVDVRILEVDSTTRGDLELSPPSPSFLAPPPPVVPGAAGAPGPAADPSVSPPPRGDGSDVRSIGEKRRELSRRRVQRRRELAADTIRARNCLNFHAFHPGEPCPFHEGTNKGKGEGQGTGGQGAAGASGAAGESPFFPGALVVFHRLVQSGQERFGIFSVNPVQVRGREAQVYRRIVARLSFLDVTPDVAETPLTAGQSFDTPTQVALAGNSTAVKIRVSADGLYKMTRAELAAAGVDVDADPRSIRMFHLGREIAIHVDGETDGIFDPTDTVWFFGTKNPFPTADNDRSSRYTDKNVYWLTIGIGFGRRMEARDAAPPGGAAAEFGPADTHVEQNNVYNARLFEWFQASDKDHWFSITTRIFNTTLGSHPLSRYTFVVPTTGLDPTAHTAKLEFAMAGGLDFQNDPNFDHHIVISVNGTVVHHAWWFDREANYGSIDIPSSLLANGNNNVEFFGPCDIPGVPQELTWINYARLVYRKRHAATADAADVRAEAAGPFQIRDFTGSAFVGVEATDATRPVWLTGLVADPDGANFIARLGAAGPGRYVVAAPLGVRAVEAILANAASNLHQTALDVDYLMVAGSALVAETDRLASYRRGTGLVVTLADVEDVYDEFTAGIPDPAAIRAFVQYAYGAGVVRRPRYLLLAGEGSLDPKNHIGTSAPDAVPLKMVDAIFATTASDSWFTLVAGNDLMPDLAYGRIPVTTAPQLAGVIDKILAYETTSPAGAWEDRVTLISDNADSAGDFRAMNESLSALIPAPYVQDKIYLSDLGLATTRTRIVSSFNAGAVFVNYHGHGFQNQFATENLFNLSQVPALANADQYFFLQALNCLNGSFQSPQNECLGEVLVENAGRGAVAFWGSSTLTIAPPQILIAASMARSLFTDGVSVVGDAQLRALLDFYGGNSWDIEYDNDILRGSICIGDPALRLRLP